MLVQVSDTLWGFSHHSAFPCDWTEPIALNPVLGNARVGGDTQQLPTCFPNPVVQLGRESAELTRQGRTWHRNECSLCPEMLIPPKEQTASSTPNTELMAALRGSPAVLEQLWAIKDCPKTILGIKS